MTKFHQKSIKNPNHKKIASRNNRNSERQVFLWRKNIQKVKTTSTALIIAGYQLHPEIDFEFTFQFSPVYVFSLYQFNVHHSLLYEKYYPFHCCECHVLVKYHQKGVACYLLPIRKLCLAKKYFSKMYNDNPHFCKNWISDKIIWLTSLLGQCYCSKISHSKYHLHWRIETWLNFKSIIVSSQYVWVILGIDSGKNSLPYTSEQIDDSNCKVIKIS